MGLNKFTLMLDGQPYEIERRGDLLVVNGIEYPCRLKDSQVTVYDTPHIVKLSGATVEVDGIRFAIEAKGLEEPKDPGSKYQVTRPSAATGANTVAAVMSGLVIKVLKSEGDPVKAGETLLILEAMKMQNQIRAGHDCTVKKVLVRPGQPVEKGEKMVILEA